MASMFWKKVIGIRSSKGGWAESFKGARDFHRANGSGESTKQTGN